MVSVKLHNIEIKTIEYRRCSSYVFKRYVHLLLISDNSWGFVYKFEIFCAENNGKF